MRDNEINDELAARNDHSAPTLDIARLKALRSSPRHKLYRGRGTSGNTVIKMITADLPSAGAVASLLHEYEVLRALDVNGVVRVVDLAFTSEGLALVLIDAGSANLAERVRSDPLSVGDFLEVAVQISEVIANLHGAHVIHRDVNPSNMVWDTVTRSVTLVDFGMATTLPSLAVESASPFQLEGTLDYISPEQTGRTGLSVDSRTDLYSLGASFYELLTGRTPFASSGSIELVHAHIARRAAPPHEVNASVPVAISRIVMKLLEKEPSRRYQTAEALSIDLQEAQRQWDEGRVISPFQLGQQDVPRELSIPDKLYGRSEAVQTLKGAFSRVRQGARELVLVTGGPGVGKSALVRRISPDVVEHDGIYIAGKFDQLQRSIPLSGLSQAFRDLVRQLLTEPEVELAAWRDKITAAISPNGQVLIEVIPELERVIGPQAPVPETGPLESKNRFQAVFTRLLQVFAQLDHPLVLFLDDLQWADAASLELLEQWIGDGTTHHLLLVGAYRDTEVDASHPLSLGLLRLESSSAPTGAIKLDPIGADDVLALVSDVVNKSVNDAAPLARLILQKTAGNPFFVRRLLHLLHAESLIRFDTDSRSWQWDLEELSRAPIADNVLDLMVRAIGRLPERTQQLLETASCIGHRFDLATLAEVSGLARTEATDQLWPAFDDGLLLPVRETYKAPRLSGPLESSLDALPGLVEFAHDRVQQAAYSVLSEEGRRTAHLAIGRHLLKSASADQSDERLFDTVDQFNLGKTLITEPAEQLMLAEQNLAAGSKARASTAYHAAMDYLTEAMALLPEHAWRDHPDLTFSVHREFAECAYLVGRHEEAEEKIEAALMHAPSKIAEADLYSLRVLAATVVGDWTRALRWGHQGLAVLGSEWPLDRVGEANDAEANAVMANVGSRDILSLVDDKEVQDQDIRACMRLLSILAPPAYFSGDEALTFLVSRGTNLSLLHGPSAYSAYAYALYAAVQNARTGENHVGYAFGNLALGLARRFGDRAEECRTLEVFGLVVQPWKAPIRDSLAHLREGYRAGIESGELAYAAFNLNSVLINSAPAGVSLSEVLEDANIAIDFATRYQNIASVEMATPFRQAARALMGRTRSFTSFDDENFSEAAFLDAAKGNQTALGFHWAAKLQSLYLGGDLAGARRIFPAAEASIPIGNLGMSTTVEHVFYKALILCADMTETGVDPDRLDEVRELHAKLSAWAIDCPENFTHKTEIIGAEIAKLEGAADRAMRLYRSAIAGASRQLFVQDEAIAHELRARLLQGQSEPDLAAVHFRAARERYHRWGASAKVRALEAELPDLFATRSHSQDPGKSLDALALIKASQAIAAEREAERLFERILSIAAELAGAEGGALVLSEDDALVVRARIEVASRDLVAIQETPLDQSPELPAAILRYVFRMKDAMVLPNAAVQEAFANDPAVSRRQIRSVLCLPLINQGKAFGLLYLENMSIVGAFTENLVEVVQVLTSQAAISLENSLLLKSLQGLTSELEERVTDRTRRLEDEMAARDKAEAALLQAQKMEAMGSLTGGVAHDFNNLLTPIVGSLDLLQRKGVGGEREQRLIAAAAQSAERAKTLVQRLLAFARRQPLQTVAVDTASLVSGMADLISSTIGPQIRVTVEAAPDLPAAQADANQLEMALLNLSLNARDAMPDGGSLRISAVEEHVESGHPSKVRPGRYVRLSVADTGVGMDEITLNRAVEPFFSTKGIGKGTGLGLSMAHGLASQLGGALSIQSRQGVGTNVEIWLPASDVAVEKMEAESKADTLTAAAGSVLLVDDEQLVRLSTADMLIDLGYNVIEASSGEEALRLSREGVQFDLLVTDHLMPGMNGNDLARTILSERPDIRVLLVSGYAESEGVAPDLPRLSKPFKGSELAASIAALAA